jgi:hypothetical protein
VLAGLDRLPDLDPPPPVQEARLLHHLDRGRSLRDRRARHDLDGRPGREDAFGHAARLDLARDVQHAGRLRALGGLDRVAVHGRPVEGREVEVGGGAAGEDAAERLGERHLLRREGGGSGEDGRKGLFDGEGGHLVSEGILTPPKGGPFVPP